MPPIFLIIATFPNSRQSSPLLYFFADYGYWIGLVMLLIVSGLVILTMGKNKQVAKTVAMVNVGVVCVALLPMIYWFLIQLF